MDPITLRPLGTDPVEVTLEQQGTQEGPIRLTLNGTEGTLAGELERLGPQGGVLRRDARVLPYYWSRTGSELHLWIDGDTYVLDLPQRDEAAADRRTAAATHGELSAPMPGILRKLLVAVGDPVEAGASVAVLESMKMQLSLPAPGAGTVSEILAAEGDMVDQGQLLLRLSQDPQPSQSE